MASIYGGASGNGWKLRLDYTVTQDRRPTHPACGCGCICTPTPRGHTIWRRTRRTTFCRDRRSIRRISTRRRDGICWESGR